MKSDKQIQSDVIAELAWEPLVNEAHIGVEVTDGVVTLAGRVASYSEKIHAETAAQRVHGVRAIAIEMDVALPIDCQKTDSEIATACLNALRWKSTIASMPLHVRVENAVVTVSGDVDWAYQRDAAGKAIRHVLGVRSVSNQISIKPTVNLTLLHSDIESVLVKRAEIEAGKIAVGIQGRTITLTGSVHTWAERQLALQVAWRTPGVNRVEDLLTLD